MRQHLATCRVCLALWSLVALECVVGASPATDARHGDIRWLNRAYEVDHRWDQVIFGGHQYGSQVGDLHLHQNRLYRQRVGHDENLPFFSVEGEWIREFKPSSNYRGFVALTTQADRTTVTLRVITDAGEEFAAIKDAWDFSWSPHGNKLAYVTGTYPSSSDDAPFDTTGTWIYNIQRGSLKKIHSGGRYVSWTAFDGRLYIYDIPDWEDRSADRVIRYDPRLRTTKITDKRGIYFSPSGLRYFMSGTSRDEPCIYDANNNEALCKTSRVLANLRPESLAWLPIEKDLLVFYSSFDSDTGALIGETRALLFDPASDRIAPLGADAVIGETTQGDLVTIEAGKISTSVPSSTDWARDLFQVAEASGGEAGPYWKGVSPRSRPFDASDPEMRCLMCRIYAVGGCAQPGKPCKPAQRLFRQGGDQLAAYLITQFERTIRDGYPNRYTTLSYIAYTQSETGFRFIRDRVANRDELPMNDRRWAVRALGHTGHPDAIDIAMELIDDPDKGINTGAVNALWRVSIDTGVLREDVLEALLELRDRRWLSARRAIYYLGEHFDLGIEEPLDALAP